MATTGTVSVHPGDLVQDADGLIYMISETHSWGCGAILQWKERGEQREAYHRLKPGQFAYVGTALMMSADIRKARQASLRLAAQILREQEAAQAAVATNPDLAGKVVQEVSWSKENCIGDPAKPGMIDAIFFTDGSVLELSGDVEIDRDDVYAVLK